MRDLDLGRIIRAEFTNSSGSSDAGSHFAVVLNTKQEIEADGIIEVAVISSNDKIALSQDMVEVPKRVLANRMKRCWVIASWLRQLPVNGEYDICERKAFGLFLQEILAKVVIVKERVKKSTQV